MKNTHTKALMYAAALFLIILSILAIAATAFVINGNRSYEENTISVTGTAEVSSEPDIATFSFTVEETAKETDEAQEVISEKVSKILNGLEDLDIDDKDIKTESYTIYPKEEWVTIKNPKEEVSVDGEIYIADRRGKYVQVGYDVSQRITLTVRNFDIVGDVLKLMTENKVENLNGPNFQIEDPEGLQDQAREEAIADAKDKAKKLAKDLGVKLGKVISFNENNGGYYPEPYFARSVGFALDAVEEASFAPELPVGENEINSSVTIIYKIK